MNETLPGAFERQQTRKIPAKLSNKKEFKSTHKKKQKNNNINPIKNVRFDPLTPYFIDYVYG